MWSERWTKGRSLRSKMGEGRETKETRRSDQSRGRRGSGVQKRGEERVLKR